MAHHDMFAFHTGVPNSGAERSVATDISPTWPLTSLYAHKMIRLNPPALLREVSFFKTTLDFLLYRSLLYLYLFRFKTWSGEAAVALLCMYCFSGDLIQYVGGSVKSYYVCIHCKLMSIKPG